MLEVYATFDAKFAEGHGSSETNQQQNEMVHHLLKIDCSHNQLGMIFPAKYTKTTKNSTQFNFYLINIQNIR